MDQREYLSSLYRQPTEEELSDPAWCERTRESLLRFLHEQAEQIEREMAEGLPPWGTNPSPDALT